MVRAIRLDVRWCGGWRRAVLVAVGGVVNALGLVVDIVGVGVMVAMVAVGTARMTWGQELPQAPAPMSALATAGTSAAMPATQEEWYAGAIRAHQREQWRRRWLPLIADGAARGLDTWTTLRVTGCSTPNREGEFACRADHYLPDAIAWHPVAMAGYSAGVVGVVWLTGRELRRHGGRHGRRWAEAVEYGDAVWDGQFAVRNLWLSRVAVPAVELSVLPRR